MNLRFIPLTVLCLLLSLAAAVAQPYDDGKTRDAAYDAEPATSLKILSWNIHCLPPFAYVNGKRKRAREIARILEQEDFDLVIFQEAFHHGARREIEKHMKSYRYRVGPANARYITIRTNSGIYIVSRIPIEKVDKVKFREKATSDDKMARKGALLVEGVKNGHRFQVIGTHLNAGGPIEVRHSQVRQIREELIEPYQSENVPQIIGGDMNMRKESDNYGFMLQTYDATDGPLEVEEAMRTDCFDKNGRLFRDDVIDFIFYRANGKDTHATRRWVPCYRKPWNKDGEQWLSDHPPMAIELIYH
jgi:endonuclease/exonuclease/phosphatase family metal-dependent hydrolase